MITAWRIVPAHYADAPFTGEGARRFGGRWNSPGRAVVYTSAHQSLAALEILVHLNPRIPLRFKAFAVHFEESWIERLPASALPPDWRNEPPGAATMRCGDRWLESGRSAVLAVPSAIIPVEENYLLNPVHPDFSRLQIDAPKDFSFDPRLLV